MRRAVTTTAVLALAAPAASCGSERDDVPVVRPVVGRIEVPEAQRLPLALSAVAGYGGVGRVARADRDFVVRGVVEPADSRVSVLDARTGRTLPATVDPRGRFAATLRAVRPGAGAYVVRATRPGRLRWAENLLLVRTGAPIEPPRTVVVPPRDWTPPVAVMRLRPTASSRRGDVVEAFTGTQSARGRPVRVRGTTLRASAETRDADAGALRVRVTVTADLLCRDSRTGKLQRVPKLWRRPPAAIERLVVPPGRTLPTTLRRTVEIDLVGRDCARGRVEGVEGEVEADATSAFELEESTPILFSARP
jgi:hypothetical protein